MIANRIEKLGFQEFINTIKKLLLNEETCNTLICG